MTSVLNAEPSTSTRTPTLGRDNLALLTKNNLREHLPIIGLKAFIYFAIQCDLKEGYLFNSHVWDEESILSFIAKWELDLTYRKVRDILIQLADQKIIEHTVQLTLTIADP